MNTDQVSVTHIFEWAARPVNNSGMFPNAVKLRAALHDCNREGNWIKSGSSDAYEEPEIGSYAVYLE